LPYDRTMLSKVVGIPKSKVLLRDEEFYKTHDIEVLRGREVTEVDPSAKKVSFSDGSSINFDTILLATGSTPFVLNVPGSGQSGVHALRSLGDSNNIIGSVEGAKKVAVIGASFIGMEVASFLRKNKNLDVTVIGLEQVPFERVLGPNVGSALQNLHEENGVKFKLGRTVKEITGKGAVDGVLLDDGTKIDADLVIMGVGVRPVTNYLKGVDRDKDGGLSVDSHLRLHKFNNVYVAGDIARFPYAHGEGDIRIEHWNVAQDTGRIAGHNMAGQSVEYKGVPFFWTNQFGVGLRYAGYSTNYDEVYVDGSIKERKFIAYYIKGGKIQAVAVMGRDPAGPAAQVLLSLDKMPTVEEVKKSSIDLTQRLNEVTA
jgi:NADPH-dependent 2,4-dienoyl-CoA reductase/sulfur reductase-like enzyme